jgi:hypothetical protein
LDIVSTGVIENCNFCGSHFSRLYTEVNAMAYKSFIVLLHIVRIELCIRNTCVKKGLLKNIGWLKMIW